MASGKETFGNVKKLLIGLGIAVLLVVAGLAVFAATFDADRYRPLVERKLSEALGKPVEIERIAARFAGGAAFELRGLTVWSGPDKRERAVGLERAVVTARILPLLRKKIEIGTVSLVRPSARIVRRKDGAVGVVGIETPAAKEPQAENGEAPAFSASLVRIEGGEFEFMDLTKEPPFEATLREVDVEIRGIAPGKSASFEASAAFSSDRPNVRVSGRATPPSGVTPLSIESLRFDVDAGAMDPKLLPLLAPGLAKNLREAPAGRLSATLESFTPGAKPEEARGTVLLEGGRVFPARLTLPVENVTLKAKLDRGDAALESFSASIGGGKAEASGTVRKVLTAAPESQFAFKLDRLPLDAIAVPGGAAKLKGFLSGAARVQATGTGDAALASLAAEGVARLDEGVILDLNVVRTVLEKLSAIPGVGEKLSARLPDEYRARLSRPHTPLGPVEVPFKIAGGRVYFERLEVRSDQFAFFARGSAGMDGTVSLAGVLLLDSNFSDAIARSVEELRLFMNAQGQIELPVRIERVGGRLTVIPDTRHIASTLAAGKGQELIGGLLRGKLGNEAPSQTQAASPSGGAGNAEPEPFEKLLSKLLSDD